MLRTRSQTTWCGTAWYGYTTLVIDLELGAPRNVSDLIVEYATCVSGLQVLSSEAVQLYGCGERGLRTYFHSVYVWQVNQ
jgi:hypothetical protein